VGFCCLFCVVVCRLGNTEVFYVIFEGFGVVVIFVVVVVLVVYQLGSVGVVLNFVLLPVVLLPACSFQ